MESTAAEQVVMLNLTHGLHWEASKRLARLLDRTPYGIRFNKVGGLQTYLRSSTRVWGFCVRPIGEVDAEYLLPMHSIDTAEKVDL